MDTILIADDEKEIRMVLKLYLENEGYRVLEAADGKEALALWKKEPVSLILLDLMMPVTDGYEVLKEVRRTDTVPVIILSAKDQDAEKILGLNLGADDYIVKPFNPLEAVARVHSNIRRIRMLRGTSDTSSEEAPAQTTEHHYLEYMDLKLDTDACLLYHGEERIELTSSEYRIMEMLMQHPGKVFTKQQIYSCGWEDDYMISDNNVMVCISKLRAKLSEDPSAYIKTIRGLGYRLEKQ